MELWIRSQDKKKLIKVNEIKIESVIDGNSFICSDITDLGSYKSKERALEVLDEIQNILKPKYILNSSSIKPNGDSWVENGMIFQNYNADAKIEELSTYVYEMPEE